MLLKLSTWNGSSINDWNGSTGSFEASIPPSANVMPSATPTFSDMGDNNAVLSGISVAGATFTFFITLHGTIHTALSTLAKYFQVAVSTSGTLVALDTADSDRSWYLTGRVIQPPTLLSDTQVTTVSVVLALDAPYWQESVLQTDTWTITSSPVGHGITTRGNLPTSPKYSFTPTAGLTDQYAYKRFVTVYNVTDRPFPNYPLSLTGTGLDTAALVTASKVQADADDWRVLYDGKEKDRWNYNFNATTTRTWINISLKKRVELTLNTALANSADVPATITFQNTTANKTAFKSLPARGILLIDSELFFYTSKGAGNSLASLYVVPSERNSRGTSYAAHSSSATVRWIEHDIWIIYGNSAATAPSVNDLAKPAIELDADSHNTQWSHDGCFWDAAGTRRGKWSKNVSLGSAHGACAITTGNHEGSADPATDPAIRIKAYKLTTWRAGVGRGEIKLVHPAGITNISGALETYRVGENWPDVDIMVSPDGKSWTSKVSVATPASVSTWTPVTVGSTALGATYRYLRLYLDGATSATASAKAIAEINSMLLTLDSNAVPVVTLGAEMSDYYLDIALYIGLYSFSLTTVTTTNVTTVVDTEALTCYNSDGAGIPIELNTNRDEWLPMIGGVTSMFTFASSGATSGLTIVTTWRGRQSL
jgi:hypothetical protein